MFRWTSLVNGKSRLYLPRGQGTSSLSVQVGHGEHENHYGHARLREATANGHHGRHGRSSVVEPV